MKSAVQSKRILIIAGPNGAGKTTYANAYLRKGSYRHFVNADLIANSEEEHVIIDWKLRNETEY
jgi:predicted ABC-type ATPase